MSKKSGYSGTEKQEALERKRIAVSVVQNRGLMKLFGRLEQKAIKEGMKAQTPQEREDFWARLKGLYGVYADLKASIEVGNALEKADQAAASGGDSERQSPARTVMTRS